MQLCGAAVDTTTDFIYHFPFATNSELDIDLRPVPGYTPEQHASMCLLVLAELEGRAELPVWFDLFDGPPAPQTTSRAQTQGELFGLVGPQILNIECSSGHDHWILSQSSRRCDFCDEIVPEGRIPSRREIL